MDIQFLQLQSIDDAKLLAGVATLHETIFGSSDNLVNKIESKPELLIFLALFDSEVVGYKMGYALDKETFYSWLGGVAPHYRTRGIASQLMEKQHHYLKQQGYKLVRTKTKNQWRSMLILNIKFGFDVMGTYLDDVGEVKIVLEKKLAD
ncbi:GNAT family N-acetyltransferase [Planococcus shixiaomingii]|uniref:GNAT family N-acetyltransferase n=1 Tax=Planococcus shixiaomingii TaxID=3058393 RepID=UPI00261E1473|nr:GNAT family N-acetyltransferase [Planococcus sp. N022]WKA54991.1 GNAT family N-acetyltransferase [Planococcus sp. N022]